MKTHRINGLATFLVFILLPVGLDAQSTGISCKHYSVQNGLTSNNIEYVYVDKEGYTWFATANGLQQFDGYNFTNYNYNADDSMSISYNFIAAISEDAAGKIWIGTLGRGVNILDKEKGIFYHLYNDAEHKQVLTSNVVIRGQEVFALDENGYMWLNTDNGLNKINTRDFSVQHYYGDYSGEILYDTEEKVLWIASNVLKKFNPQNQQIDYYQIYTPQVHGLVRINSCAMDQDGMLWLGTTAGLLVFNKTLGRFYSLEEYFGGVGKANRKDYSWSSNPVESAYIDYQGFIWIAIDKSLIKLDKHQGSFQVFTHETDNPGSLQDAKVVGIYGSDSRAFWIIYASMGVSRINVALEAFTYYRSIPGDSNSLSANIVRSVYKDKRQNLWIGNYSDGLNRVMANDSGHMIHYKHDPLNPYTLNSNYITSILVDSRERLWVGTFDKGFCSADHIYQSPKLSFKRYQYEQNLEVQDFCEDAAGDIWIGSQWGLYMYDYSEDRLIHYGDQEKQIQEMQQVNIQSVLYESPNTFWIASWNRGLCRLRIFSDTHLSGRVAADSLTVYEGIKDIHNSNIDNCFITLHKNGNVIWLGSNVNGLVKMKLEKHGANFVKYDQDMGAPGNCVYGIAEDRNGNLWLSTNHGMAEFDPVKQKFLNFFESDGLPSNAFGWNTCFQNTDGQIFFGGINGLIAFYPEELIKDTTRNTVRISRLMVQNKELQIGDKVNGREILTKNIQYTDSITLTYREPAFTIEFVALNAINPEEIIYSYKLDGFDKDWIHTTAQKRYVTYTNLRQGTYTFLVRAANNIGDWEQQATSLTIRILPPWWETSYALVTFSVLFIGLLFLFRWLILMRARLVHQAKLEHLEREKAEELYQFKMRFFTDISHEFRTPLSLILAPMENILSKVEKDPNTEKQSQIIRKNADRLLRLIEQVMDLRKIDLNKMKLSLSKGDIVAYVRDLTYSFEEIAIQRSMILEFSTDVESLVTWFDENKVEKILGNTLSNAFKFTPDRGKIQVSIQKLPGPVKSSGRHADPLDMNEFIEICIRDNGIGIPDEDKDRLFERFYMVERHDTIVRRGTGIGLALTKELVDLHKGTIRVESKENKGTNIVILLPVISDPAKAGEMVEILPERTKAGEPIQRFASAEDHEYIYKYTHQKNLAHHDKKKPILLLVEDEAEVRAFIRENFESDFQIYEAADGKTGLEIAIRNDPDIIISDIIMPRMDGVEMCQKLKSDLRTSHIPLILLTARSSMESKMEGLGTGADAYLEKPFSLDLLKMQVGNILDNRKILRNKFSKELVLKPSEIAITPVDAQFLQKAIDIVEKHMADPDFGSDAFCHEIGMSRSQLHRKLKGLTSQPASEFIRTMRLERAVRLLEQSQLSIEEISMNVGFNSPAYFSKCFKNHFGKTPSEHAGRQ